MAYGTLTHLSLSQCPMHTFDVGVCVSTLYGDVEAQYLSHRIEYLILFSYGKILFLS